MVFNRIAEFLSAAANRLSVSQTSNVPYISAKTSPQAVSGHGFGFPAAGQKNSLRLSSSLQDFSAYQHLDPEEGYLKPGANRTMIHAKQAHSLQRENAGSSFSKDKGVQGKPLTRRKWLRVVMILLCVLSFSFLTYTLINYLYSNWSQEASKFYVVLDCGSTGTRVFVYQATIEHKNDGGLPIVLSSFPEGQFKKSRSQIGRAYDRMETEPGFDKLVNNVSGLKAAINPLLGWAKKQIPKRAHKTTSLFLYATAGVRRLPASDSEWLLDNAFHIVKDSPFFCRREWVKTISGMEEAYYGWIALNYRTGFLGAAKKKGTYGALDLGGSSLQVTFESKERVHNETSLNLSIGAVNHHLSAYSLSGYGLNDAFDKSVVSLLKGLPKITSADLINGKVKVKHPCLQSGYKEEYICSHCVSIYPEAGGPLFGGKSSGKGVKPGIRIQLIGAPQWEECSALAKVTVNLSEWSNLSPGIDCDLQPCALSNSLPRPHGKFYAISGFFVVYRFFNLTSEAALDDILEKGREYCGKSWEVAKNSVIPQPFIEQYCFRAPYIVLLLREGLHITDEQINIGSGSITWTLGVALLEAGNAFSKRTDLHRYEILQMKINPLILSAIFFVSLLLLICVLSCVGNRMPRFFRRPYLPLFRHNSASASSVLNISSPFNFQRWSPISSGEGRAKLPLSRTATSGQTRLFGGTGHALGGNSIQLIESSLYPTTSSVLHSYSSDSLGNMQFDTNGIGSGWSPHRSQTHLQSRRSQSREDLSASVADIVKV